MRKDYNKHKHFVGPKKQYFYRRILKDKLHSKFTELEQYISTFRFPYIMHIMHNMHNIAYYMHIMHVKYS